MADRLGELPVDVRDPFWSLDPWLATKSWRFSA
jgi:hypothetical protein